MIQDDKNLIERYLDNSLSGVELKKFMDRLESDEEFRQSVSLQNLLIESIQHAEDARLENALEESLNYKKPLIPFGLKMILIFLFVTLSGILLFEYIGNGPKRHITNFAMFDIFKKAKEKPIKNKPAVVLKEESADTTVSDENSEATDEKAISTEETAVSDSSALAGEDMVVKKDQLLVSVTLMASELNQSKKSGESGTLAQSATDKLNPAAGLVESKDAKEEKYEVEFWVSPVNYKGYKLISNKLILFGVEEPDAVRLFNSDNQLLMKYGKEIYLLVPSGDFLSFAPLKDNELPAALR